MEKNEHPLSWQALARIVAMGVIVVLFWKALPAFPVILIAFVLATALYPIVKIVQKKTKMPKLLTIFLVLIAPIIPFIYWAFTFIPRIAGEIPNMFLTLSNTITHSNILPVFLRSFNLLGYIQSHFDYASTTMNIAVMLLAIITTVVLTFFLVYDADRLFELFLHTVPHKEREKIRELFLEVSRVTGKYIRGNLLISLICGIVIFVGLTLLNIPFALPLAVFAAIMDLLPLVGQTIGAIPAVIIAFGISPITGLLVIALYFLSQEAENIILSPVIYNKALNLYPSVSFLSVLIGASLFGILGAFLSLPVAASIPAIIHYHKNYKIRHHT